MSQELENKIHAIDKKIQITTLIDGVGTLIFGLAAYTKFLNEGEPLHPILNNDLLINIMLGVGGIIMIWGVYKIITLGRERKRMLNEQNI